MKKMMEFIRKERLYILLLIFIILVNVIITIAGEEEDKTKAKEAPAASISAEGGAAKKADEDIFLKHEALEKILREKRHLALLFSLASLLILAMLFLGTIIDAILISFFYNQISQSCINLDDFCQLLFSLWM